MTAEEVKIVENLRKRWGILLAVVALVLAGVVLALLSGGCASERPQAAVRAKASPAAGPTDARTAAYAYETEAKGAGPYIAPDRPSGGSEPAPSAPSEAPKDKNLLSLKDRLKIPLESVMLRYERLQYQIVAIQAEAADYEANQQIARREKGLEWGKKVTKYNEAFEKDTGILPQEAARIYAQLNPSRLRPAQPQVPAQGKK